MARMFAADDPVYSAIYRGASMKDATRADLKEFDALLDEAVFGGDLPECFKNSKTCTPEKKKLPLSEFRAKSRHISATKSCNSTPQAPLSPLRDVSLTPRTYKKELKRYTVDKTRRKLF